jgi:predicted amidophosphoribosyltransferase
MAGDRAAVEVHRYARSAYDEPVRRRAVEVVEDPRASYDRLPARHVLVDDRSDTGWTMAIAARLLLRAGAPSVLPFSLATTT